MVFRRRRSGVGVGRQKWRRRCGEASASATFMCGFMAAACRGVGTQRSGRPWRWRCGRITLSVGGLHVCLPAAACDSVGVWGRGRAAEQDSLAVVAWAACPWRRGRAADRATSAAVRVAYPF